MSSSGGAEFASHGGVETCRINYTLLFGYMDAIRCGAQEQGGEEEEKEEEEEEEEEEDEDEGRRRTTRS